jgi:transglutaminase-like putative cysteine protease
VEPSFLLEGQSETYTVISQAADVTANQLAAAPVEYPAEISAAYLPLPGDLPNRIRQLANRIAGGTDNPYLKAIAIQNYLRGNFPYDLNVDPAPSQRDVVDYFLFDVKRGFCSHYATAMAVMLRSERVPARVVTGYAMGDWVQEEQGFRVPVSYAHAWVEVYFPGLGWIEFEPTAYRPPIIYPEDAPMDEPPPVVQIEPEPPAQLPAFLAYLVIAAALGLIALPFVLMRLFTTSRGAPAVQADVLYRRMRRALAWAGLPAAPSVTPDEYLAAYDAQLAEYQQIDRALRQITAVYREMVYSPHPPDERRVRAAGALWQQSLSEWVRMVVKAKWAKMRGRGDASSRIPGGFNRQATESKNHLGCDC